MDHKMVVKDKSYDAECSCRGWWYALVNPKVVTKEWIERSRQKSFQKHVNSAIRQGG